MAAVTESSGRPPALSEAVYVLACPAMRVKDVTRRHTAALQDIFGVACARHHVSAQCEGSITGSVWAVQETQTGAATKKAGGYNKEEQRMVLFIPFDADLSLVDLTIVAPVARTRLGKQARRRRNLEQGRGGRQTPQVQHLADKTKQRQLSQPPTMPALTPRA